MTEQPQPQITIPEGMGTGFKDVSDFSKWRLDTESIVTEIEHNLKGEFWDEIKGKWKRKGIALLNEEGVKAIAGLIRIMVNKNSVLSNLTSEEVTKVGRDINDSLIDQFFFEWHYYKVKKETLLSGFLISQVMNFVLMSLKRAQDEGERAALREHVIRHYQESIGGAMPTKSRLSIPFLSKKQTQEQI